MVTLSPSARVTTAVPGSGNEHRTRTATSGVVDGRPARCRGDLPGGRLTVGRSSIGTEGRGAGSEAHTHRLRSGTRATHRRVLKPGQSSFVAARRASLLPGLLGPSRLPASAAAPPSGCSDASSSNRAAMKRALEVVIRGARRRLPLSRRDRGKSVPVGMGVCGV